MRKLLISLAAAAAVVTFAPVASYAQGISVDTPVGGVRIGEPRHHHYRSYDDGPRVERRVYREREVRMGRGCRTVTIRSDDGYVKRIRKCDY
jgi:hypothetical protein